MEPAAVLNVRDLTTTIRTEQGTVRPVDGVSFSLAPGRTLCIVGESGSGKSLTALSLMGLVPPPPKMVVGGSVELAGQALTLQDATTMAAVRGKRIGMIFQEPMTALNPSFTIGRQIAERVLRHEKVSRGEAAERALAMLERVHIPGAERRMSDYPHQLSGGMRQRVMIAMALVNRPQVLLADEPTTALDVTIQAQILDLIRELQDELGAAVVMITHDLGVVAEVADDVAVMYAGRIVEQGPAAQVLEDPLHPYTIGLLGCLPRLDRTAEHLTAIRGTVPSLFALPQGCRFTTRCPFVADICRQQDPALEAKAPGHAAACWRVPIERLALSA